MATPCAAWTCLASAPRPTTGRILRTTTSRMSASRLWARSRPAPARPAGCSRARPRACRRARRCRRLPSRWTDGGESRVTVLRGVRSGAYVRRTGDDVQPGDVAVRAGTIIGPAQVGLLAAVGRERVLVHPRPRLSVMCVGGELLDISRTPGNGQVYDVNSYALAAAGRDAGAEVNRVGIVDTEPNE